MKIIKISFRNALDMLSKLLSENIFNNIKNKNYNFKLNFLKTDYVEINNLNISILNCNVFVDRNINNNFLCGGYFNNLDKELVINIKINDLKFGKEKYSNLLSSLISVIRHELEHALYSKNNQDHNPEYLEEEDGDNLNLKQKIDLAYTYLKDKSEIQAFIRQSMIGAKYSKINFLDELNQNIVRELFWRNNIDIKNLNKNSQLGKYIHNLYGEIYNIYIEESKKIFPEVFK